VKSMLSSSPMYAAGSAANATLWQAVAEYLRHAGVADVPKTLSMPTDLMAHLSVPLQSVTFALIVSMCHQINRQQ